MTFNKNFCNEIIPHKAGEFLIGDFMLAKIRTIIFASILLQSFSSHAYSVGTQKILYLLGALAINCIPGVNGNIGDICPTPSSLTGMSGTYQLQASIPKENDNKHAHEEEKDYLYSDEDCLLPLNHSLDFLSLYPGDRIVGLKVDQNGVIHTENVRVLPPDAAAMSKGPEYWKRAAVVINSSMNLQTAERVMQRSADYFSEVSRGLLKMDTKVFSVSGAISCDLRRNYKNLYDEVRNQGFDLNHFSKVTFIGNFPCNWGGVAFVGGKLSAIQAYSEEAAVAVEIHESGHLNRGGHASTEYEEYGDRNDPLGNGYNHVRFNAPHLEQFGYLKSGEIAGITSSSYGNYELRNLDDTDNNQNELQVLRISYGSGPDIFVSFRNRVADNSYSKQLKSSKVVEIHTHEGKVGEQTILRARLTEGDSYCVGGSGTLINVTEVDSDYANVELVEHVMPTQAPTSSPSPSFRGSYEPSAAPTAIGDWCPVSPNKKINKLILYPAIGAGGLLITGSLGICLYYSCKKNKK